MLDVYFKEPVVLREVKSPILTQCLDSFAEELDTAGFEKEHLRNQIRGAAHLCTWAEKHGISADAFNADLVARFGRHLTRCGCPGPERSRSRHIPGWALRFVGHLRRIGVTQDIDDVHPEGTRSTLLLGFLDWMKQHRGVGSRTLQRYEGHIADLLENIGEDPARFTAGEIRRFLERKSTPRKGGARKLFSAVRMFLRYLTVETQCPVGLNYAVPRIASWSQQSVPQYLPPADVENLIAACDPRDKVGVRDRAILLLLARLGLRAGDVAGLCLTDISWPNATIRLAGKGRRESVLPLPQEVGDAILAYLELGRPRIDSEHIFLRCCAPFRPFRHGGPVSHIVRRAFLRSGIEAPSRGSHILRHSLATEMLRNGTPLYGIAAVLRHRSMDTTRIYAKVDFNLLRQVTQPWPEVLR